MAVQNTKVVHKIEVKIKIKKKSRIRTEHNTKVEHKFELVQQNEDKKHIHPQKRKKKKPGRVSKGKGVEEAHRLSLFRRLAEKSTEENVCK